MPLVMLTGRLICKDAAEAETVRRFLPDHIRLTRAEPACLKFEVTATDNPLIWQVDEAFTDEAGFAAHQSRTQSSAWASATRHITRDFIKTPA